MGAVLELQNTAGADAGFSRVTGGEAGESDVAARLEGQDVGVAGDGGDGVTRHVAAVSYTHLYRSRRPDSRGVHP